MVKKAKSIKVLNVAQPFAHQIIFGDKNIENRTSNSHYRGPVAIYASKNISKIRFEKSKFTEEDCSFGKIIGFVNLDKVVKENDSIALRSKHFVGPFGYVFSQPIALKTPIEVLPPHGAIVWWNLEDKKLLKLILEQFD